MVGKIILHAVINKCKGIKGISQTAINYILSGNRESVLEDVTVNDVPDPCLQQNLVRYTIAMDYAHILINIFDY